DDRLVDITDLGALAANWKYGVAGPLTADASDGQAEGGESATEAVGPLAEPINDGPGQTAAISDAALLAAEPDRRGGVVKRGGSSDTQGAVDSIGIFLAAATMGGDLLAPGTGLATAAWEDAPFAARVRFAYRARKSGTGTSAALRSQSPFSWVAAVGLGEVDLLAGPSLAVLPAAVA
ncbi:hypothetical protein LCGC14_2554400, partial [marine sediment metagenome]